MRRRWRINPAWAVIIAVVWYVAWFAAMIVWGDKADGNMGLVGGVGLVAVFGPPVGLIVGLLLSTARGAGWTLRQRPVERVTEPITEDLRARSDKTSPG